jgi:CheY-like chemotaxis protein
LCASPPGQHGSERPIAWFPYSNDCIALSSTQDQSENNGLHWISRARNAEGKAITVLCVDDEQQTALRSVLESEGYKVLVAASGSEGLETFKSEAVNAVILDYWMMDMSGLKVAQQIRQLSRSVPIIMLSSYIELLDESLGLVDVWIRKGERSPRYLLNRLAELLDVGSSA